MRQTRVDVESQANQLKGEIENLNKKAASVRRERLDEYSRYLRKNFLSLDVKSYSEAVFQTLTPSLFETGSTLPRALLAYQFAIVLLISEHSPATMCPIIIDAPNQQGQDKEHLPQILKFIAENQPAGTQLILGIENDTGVEFGGKTINTPVEKYALLQSDQYESVHTEIFNVLKASLQ